MSRINTVNHETAEGKTKELLDAVKSKLGFAPNLMKGLAHSPTALEAYLNLNGTLGTTLNAKLREQIAVLSAEENGCGYCLSAHTLLGKNAGLTDEEVLAARTGIGNDERNSAALKFAHAVISKRGKVSDDDLQAVKNAGFIDGEIAEIVGNIALNAFTNYFNEVARTEIDFPKVELFAKSNAA